MKPGDLVRVRNAEVHLHGQLGIIIGEKMEWAGQTSYIKAFVDRVRMFPCRWLEILQPK
jgi:hypothetical protein